MLAGRSFRRICGALACTGALVLLVFAGCNSGTVPVPGQQLGDQSDGGTTTGSTMATTGTTTTGTTTGTFLTGTTTGTTTTGTTTTGTTTGTTTTGTTTGTTTIATGTTTGTTTTGTTTGTATTGTSTGTATTGTTTGASACGGGAGEDAGFAGDGACAAQGCAGKSYKFCEDFDEDGGTIGALPLQWTNFEGYGGDHTATDVALANDMFHSGPNSLKSDSADKGQNRAQHSLSAIGATAYDHWGRIFYKVQSPSPKPTTYLHETFVSMNGPSGENRIVDTVEMTGTNEHQWLFNIPSDSCCTSSSYNWTFDADWHCAEWWVDVTTGSYRFFSDAAEVTALAFSGKAASATTMSDYTDIIVGATFYQNTGAIASPFVIWFDDLAIDDNRIGCQ